MYDATQELERFSTNAWQGRAEGLWYTIVIGLGSQAGEVQTKFLDVVGSWLRIAEPIHREYGFSCSRDRFPPPEELAPRLPAWFMDTFVAGTDQEIIE
ncbi:MAG TPA: hypothetical protein VJO13_19670, partial [Ktedonobacterales bacterium]|nr:hypothetical protein [Ktedonobacterales bacterium]